MGSIHIQMLPKALAAGAPPTDPPIAKESAFEASTLTRRVVNGVEAIQKWVPFTPKFSQKPVLILDSRFWEGKTHIWGVNLMHFLMFFVFWVFFWGGGDLGFWEGEIPSRR